MFTTHICISHSTDDGLLGRLAFRPPCLDVAVGSCDQFLQIQRLLFSFFLPLLDLLQLLHQPLFFLDL